MAPRRILVLFAHPAIRRSRVNRRLASAAQEVVGLTFHDLYEAYPDFDVDVRAEQRLLEDHDLVVLQHPFYWYGAPALVKQWIDLVLEHGWAYGRQGSALRGKEVLSAISAGGSEETYRHEGFNRFTVRELLVPVEQTFRLCGMDYLPPFVVYGTHRLGDDDIGRHAADYQRVLEGLRDRTLDVDATREHPRLNWKLDQVMRG